MYGFVCIVLFFLLPQPVLLQQSSFQRALIKNANKIRFTSASAKRPGRGEGEGGWRGREVFI